MTRRLLVEHAYAKINWTLEVLGKRDDGYHEVRAILQTIDLSDTVTLSAADAISLEITGASPSLTGEAIESNLAYRAAVRLRDECSYRGGVQIALEKRIPVAAGLGGGSSDAAATLRGLNRLWSLRLHNEELLALAAQLGSDVPFFIRGGTALASGRGEVIEALPDVPKQHLVIAWEERELAPDKTARMYAAVRPEHYTGGSRTKTLATRIRADQPVRDGDIGNAFEAALGQADPQAVKLFERVARLGIGRPHLCGSGPALFLLLEPAQAAKPSTEALASIGLRATETHTIAADALAIDEALDG